jgi:hypothetical protein
VSWEETRSLPLTHGVFSFELTIHWSILAGHDVPTDYRKGFLQLYPSDNHVLPALRSGNCVVGCSTLLSGVLAGISLLLEARPCCRSLEQKQAQQCMHWASLFLTKMSYLTFIPDQTLYNVRCWAVDCGVHSPQIWHIYLYSMFALAFWCNLGNKSEIASIIKYTLGFSLDFDTQNLIMVTCSRHVTWKCHVMWKC